MPIRFSDFCLLGISLYILWRLLRIVTKRSPLSDIPGPPSDSLIFGNFKNIYNNNGWDYHRRIWDYGGVVKIKGLYRRDMLYIYDPLALYHILIKDHSFEEPVIISLMNHISTGKSLLSTLGEEHKKMKKMLNPVFSAKHMRNLLPVLYPIVHQLRDGILSEIRQGKEDIDVMSWMTRAALEYIGQGGLGHSFRSFEHDGKGDLYGDAIKSLLPLSFRLYVFRDVIPYIKNFVAPRFGRFLVNNLPFSLPRDFMKVVDTLEEASIHILKKKREALAKGDDLIEDMTGKGKDIISILLKENINSDLPEHEIIGHMNAFLFAATDTTTSALSRILSLLAENQDVQEKLREEVVAARKELGDLDYDTLQALPYLDAVCRETLRVYPPISSVPRETLKDTTVPVYFPIRSADGLSEIREVFIPKGTELYISILAANRCKKIWGDDAEEWKPSRWLEPLPASVSEARLPGVYSQMMTFLGGGRSCIGFKLSEMETKMVLSVLIESFFLEPAAEVSWDMGFITVPRVKDSVDTIPKLPLKITAVPRV